MSETVIYDCGHCDVKGICERGSGEWSCKTCTDKYRGGGIFYDPSNMAVKCNICNGEGKLVKIIS